MLSRLPKTSPHRSTPLAIRISSITQERLRNTCLQRAPSRFNSTSKPINPHHPTVFETIAKASLLRPTFQFRFAAAGLAKPTNHESEVHSLDRRAIDLEDEENKTRGGSNGGGSGGGGGGPIAFNTSMNVDQQGLCVRVGEDAYFVRKDGLGVADGVGGWSQVVKGSNAALFSSRLMHHVAAQLEYYDDFTNEYDINEYYSLNPVKVMQVACERTLDDAGKGESRAVGSTTALIAFLRDDELRVASLGDTSLLILRNGNLIFRTEEQQHSFNFPYQLGSDSKDTPEKDAGQYAVKIREGDLVIVGSDGIFDNLFDEDILDIVNAVVMGTPSATTASTTTGATAGPLKLQTARILRTDPQQVATAILAKAREVSLDTGPYVVSPFQERAVNEGLYYQGGKLDDLTVVVGIVGVAEDSPDRR